MMLNIVLTVIYMKKSKKRIVALAALILLTCLCIAVVFIVKPLYSSKNTNVNNEKSISSWSVGSPMYLDYKQSMNPDTVKSIEIDDDKVVLQNENSPAVYGIVTKTEHISGKDFYDYWNSFDLTDISPIDLLEYSDIRIDSICDNSDSLDCKYKLYSIDNQPILLGFVSQDEFGNDVVWCISNINNDAVYKKQISVTKKSAIETADEKHKELYSDMNYSINDVAFKDKSEQYYAWNTQYNPNDSGHAYYAVAFFDEDSVADYYYYCIDVITGDIIYNSMMGD